MRKHTDIIMLRGDDDTEDIKERTIYQGDKQRANR